MLRKDAGRFSASSPGIRIDSSARTGQQMAEGKRRNKRPWPLRANVGQKFQRAAAKDRPGSGIQTRRLRSPSKSEKALSKRERATSVVVLRGRAVSSWIANLHGDYAPTWGKREESGKLRFGIRSR